MGGCMDGRSERDRHATPESYQRKWGLRAAHWSQKFRVTPDHLKPAVQKGSLMAKDIQPHPGSEALDA